MPTKQSIHGYFSKLNPVAEKIAFDISEVKAAYDHVWLTLTTTEQDNILNDTIIKPEITIRYYKNCISPTTTTNIQSPKEDARRLSVENKVKTNKHQKHNIIYTYDRQSLRTFIHQNVGLKILHDENIGDYRDEHSFPFSYRTKSQINLAVIVSNSNIPVSDTDLCKPILQVSTKNLQPAQRKVLNETEQSNQIISVEKSPQKINKINYAEPIYLVDDEKLNLLSSFGSKNTLLSISTDSTDFENDTKEQHAENCKLLPDDVQLPKGFDFLSNW